MDADDDDNCPPFAPSPVIERYYRHFVVPEFNQYLSTAQTIAPLQFAPPSVSSFRRYIQYHRNGL